MATATVTGTLADIRLESMAGLSPQILFTLSEPATNPDGFLVSTEPTVVVPDSGGDFSVDLVVTEDLSPHAYIQIQIRWLDSAGGFIRVDYPNWRLYVPDVGGSLGELLDVPIGSYLIWVNEGGVVPPGARPGDYILDSLTGDLFHLE